MKKKWNSKTSFSHIILKRNGSFFEDVNFIVGDRVFVFFSSKFGSIMVFDFMDLSRAANSMETGTGPGEGVTGVHTPLFKEKKIPKI